MFVSDQESEIEINIELDDDFDLTGFIEYIFRDGSREQKRDLIGCIKAELYLENRIITTKTE